MIFSPGCAANEIVDAIPVAPGGTDRGSAEDGGQDIGGMDAPPDGTDTGTGAVARCAPGADPAYATEGDRVEIAIRCTGAEDALTLRMPDLPAGAEFDADARLLRWTTGLDQGGRWDLAVEADLADGDDVVTERGVAVAWIADAWDASGNEPVDPAHYQEELGLPVLHLDPDPGINSYDNVPVRATYRGHEFAGAGIQLRGAASLYYPKNSYKIAFEKEDQFEDESVGFDKRRNLVLTSTFDDNAYFRQAMCFDLWNRQRPSREQSVQWFFVVVFLEGEYHGLYLGTDHVDAEYWQDQGFSEDINLYKSVDHSANFYDSYGSPKSNWASGYEKKEGDMADWSDIEGLVEFVALAPDGPFLRDIDTRVDLEDIYDWWSLVVFTEADDSGAKNAYLVNDPAVPQFHHVPWDFNHSLGQTWQTDREAATYAYDFTSANNLFLRLLASDEFGDTMRGTMLDALDGPWSEDELSSIVDGYMAAIGPSAARDWDKWADRYETYGGWSWRSNWTTHEEEVAYVRAWLAERHDYVEAWISSL